MAKIILLAIAFVIGSVPLQGQQPPVDYRARTIYFILTDRFAAHQPYDPYVDPEYPDATNIVNCFEQLCPAEEQWRKYWGGDVAGVSQKLDYLTDLGISALWITPLMENVRAYEGGTGYGTGYHGYWVQNYDRPNPHFGSWDDIDRLSKQLHSKSIKYMQDITLNHSNPYDNHVYGRLYRSEAEKVFIDSYDDDFDAKYGLRYYKHFQQTKQCIQAEMESDANWNYWQLHHCLLADLSGYNQHDPTIANYLVNAGKLWLNHGVDDFRLDAVKFPFPDFIARFTHTMIAHSEELGRPAPYIVGEWSNGGVGDAKSLRFANHYEYFRTDILDFKLSLMLNQFIGGSFEDPTQLASAIDLDNLLQERVAAFHGRDTWQGTFIDNHDQIRTMVRLDKIGITSETERQRRMDLATVLLMMVRGIPIIYYGDEQYLAEYDLYELNGGSYSKSTINAYGDDPFNRPGMKDWNEDTSAFQIIQKLAALRSANPAIWKGSYSSVYADQDILIFERKEGSNAVLVAVNRGAEKDVVVPSSFDFAPGRYRGLIADVNNANRGNYIEIGAGNSTFHLGAISSLVLPKQ